MKCWLTNEDAVETYIIYNYICLSGPCDPDTGGLLCNDGNKCVAADNICDGIMHCIQEEDEETCGKQSFNVKGILAKCGDQCWNRAVISAAQPRPTIFRPGPARFQISKYRHDLGSCFFFTASHFSSNLIGRLYVRHAVHRVCKALNVSLSWDVNNGPLRAKLGRIPETSNFVHLEVRNAT